MLLHLVAALLSWAAAARADGNGPVGVDVGPVTFQPVSVLDTHEITHKWWFWVIIGVIALFLIVGGYFTWRGFRQWKLAKKKEAEYEEAEKQKQDGAKSVSDGPDVEAAEGRVTVQQLTPEERWAALQKDPAWLAEKARRTAVHPAKPRW